MQRVPWDERVVWEHTGLRSITLEYLLSSGIVTGWQPASLRGSHIGINEAAADSKWLDRIVVSS